MNIYPAIVIVHWPGKDVPACLVHAGQLISVGQTIGCDVSATPIPTEKQGDVECTNCANQAKKGEAQR